MVVVIFVDLTGATAEMAREGDKMTSPEILLRLEVCERTLRAADPTVVRLGPPLGDGLLLVGQAPLPLVQAASQVQDLWQAVPALRRGMPARIALGVGEVEWVNGPPWQSTSTVHGTVVNLVARLRDICPAGAVIVSEGLHAMAIADPAIASRLERHSVTLKGFAEQQPYWLLRSASVRKDIAGSMDSEREFGQISERVHVLQDNVAELRRETREGFQRLEVIMSTRLDAHSKRLGTLERWRAWILGGLAMLAALFGGNLLSRLWP